MHICMCTCMLVQEEVRRGHGILWRGIRWWQTISDTELSLRLQGSSQTSVSSLMCALSLWFLSASSHFSFLTWRVSLQQQKVTTYAEPTQNKTLFNTEVNQVTQKPISLCLCLSPRVKNILNFLFGLLLHFATLKVPATGSDRNPLDGPCLSWLTGFCAFDLSPRKPFLSFPVPPRSPQSTIRQIVLQYRTLPKLCPKADKQNTEFTSTS